MDTKTVKYVKNAEEYELEIEHNSSDMFLIGVTRLRDEHEIDADEFEDSLDDTDWAAIELLLEEVS